MTTDPRETGIAERFLEALCARADALVVGDPRADSTQMGPVVSASARNDILGGIDTAKAQGASVLAGCDYRDGPLTEGHFVAPTIVELTAPADIWTEELFGPVLAVRRPPAELTALRQRCSIIPAA